MTYQSTLLSLPFKRTENIGTEREREWGGGGRERAYSGVISDAAILSAVSGFFLTSQIILQAGKIVKYFISMCLLVE